MHKIFWLLFAVAPLNTFCQVTDDFSDGDFTANPVWTADNSSHWIISSGQLRSNSLTPSSTFYITTTSSIGTEAQWNFTIHLPFNTSSANYVDVYVMSEQANLTSTSNNGYFVRIGGTSDEIGLWKMVAGTASQMIDGVNGITNTSNNLIRISVTRDAANVWTLQRDVGLTGTYFTEGTVTDATFLNAAFFGIRITQSTSSFHNKHYFDDFYIGGLVTDTSPPTVISVTPISDKELEVLFSEKVERLSAESFANYSVDQGVGSATEAFLQEDERTVSLLFSNSFPNADTSRLTVRNVADLLGNKLLSEEQKFFSFRPIPALARDIIFSEIFADPNPTVGLPEGEFVEIYNRSTKAFDLAGWKFADATVEKVLPSKIIFPGEYVVLVNSSLASAYASFPNVLPVTGFPTLTNTGELLKLLDASGNIIDSVFYDDDWYKDEEKKAGGYSLERISQENFCVTDSENWIASKHAAGGTPGSTNTVLNNETDVDGPKLLSAQVRSQHQIRLTFNEKLNNTAILLSQFVLSPSVQLDKVFFNDSLLTSVEVVFAEELRPSVIYTLTGQDIQDCTGNAIGGDNTITFVLPELATAKDIIITEIFADPNPIVALPEAEFVELHNRSEKVIDLKDWSIRDGSAEGVFPTHILLPGDYVLVCSVSDANAFDFYGTTLGLTNFPSLNNTGESIMLYDNKGTRIDSLNFTTDWYRSEDKEAGGWSLELIDTENSCGEEANWTASESEQGGTPGKENSVKASKPDTTPPQLLSVTPENETCVLLLFNEKLERRTPPLASFTLTPSTPLSTVTFTNTSLRELRLSFETSLETKTLYELRVEQVYDCAGNEIEKEAPRQPFALPETPTIGDVFLNEILFNPRISGADFVEVYNHSTKFINLKELRLANRMNELLINEKALTDQNILLHPNSYLVFSPDVNNVMGEYPQSAHDRFFETAIPPMNDEGGSLVLLTSEGLVIDELLYSRDMHSALVKEEEGVSLERVSMQVSAMMKNNWRSGVKATHFATPGYQNANSQGNSLGQEEVRVEPEVFEPLVGQPNFTSIQYRFDQGGLIANAKIFDAQGRLVKSLTNNEILGTEGFFTWDGDQDDGARARIGYYTLWMEVFDTSGFVKTFRKRIVIASRF